MTRSLVLTLLLLGGCSESFAVGDAGAPLRLDGAAPPPLPDGPDGGRPDAGGPAECARDLDCARAPRCADATTRRTFEARCEAGACVFAPVDAPCPDACASGACRACEDGAGWRDTPAPPVRPRTASGSSLSLRFDGDGGAHVVYGVSTDAAGTAYGYRAPGGEWAVETIPASVLWPRSLALDARGRPVVTLGSSRLEIARRDDDGWTVAPLPSRFTLFQSQARSIVVNADGTLDAMVVGFVDDERAFVHVHGSFEAGFEVTEVPVWPRQSVIAPTLARDADGVLHLASRVYNWGLFVIAQRADGSFDVEDAVFVDDREALAATVAMTASADGALHVAYGARPDRGGELLYARRDRDGAWTHESVTTFAPPPEGTDRVIAPDLVVDDRGAVHLTTPATDDGHPVHASRAADGQPFVIAAIDEWPATSSTALGAAPGGDLELLFQLDTAYVLDRRVEARVLGCR